MDVIAMARELGKTLQQDERYLKMRIAMQNTEDDVQLQGLIGEFNLKRLAINNEAGKENRDQEKLQQLNQELRALHTQIIGSEVMQTYQAAQNEFDDVIKRVEAIISASANGEDPETADYSPDACGGNCSSCAGCH